MQENCYCKLIVVLKLIFIFKVFSAKLYAHEMFAWREFETTFFESYQKYLRTPGLDDRRDLSPILYDMDTLHSLFEMIRYLNISIVFLFINVH